MRARIHISRAHTPFILTGCSSYPPRLLLRRKFSALAEYEQQKLDWSSCYDYFECTELRVPIDYDDLSVGTFRISVLRAAAKDQDNRLGSIVVNPGGPGGSGVDYAYNADYIFSPDITDVYDIVGFDPRGVAESEPIACFTPEELDANLSHQIPSPITKLKSQQHLKNPRPSLKSVLENTEYLEHFTTSETARDMDILRAALGETKLKLRRKILRNIPRHLIRRNLSQ